MELNLKVNTSAAKDIEQAIELLQKALEIAKKPDAVQEATERLKAAICKAA